MAEKRHNYAIYACDQMYGGLHGMNNFCVFYGTEEEADAIGREMSEKIVQDYDSIDEILIADATFHDVFNEAAYAQLQEDDMDWEIARISDAETVDYFEGLIDCGWEYEDIVNEYGLED